MAQQQSFSKKALIALTVLILLAGAIYLVAADITPAPNLNGFNRYFITNYTQIQDHYYVAPNANSSDIQAKIASNRVLVIPAGLYQLSNNIKLNNLQNFTLIINDGAKIKFLNGAAPDYTQDLKDNTNTTFLFWGENSTNIKIIQDGITDGTTPNSSFYGSVVINANYHIVNFTNFEFTGRGRFENFDIGVMVIDSTNVDVHDLHGSSFYRGGIVASEGNVNSRYTDLSCNYCQEVVDSNAADVNTVISNIYLYDTNYTDQEAVDVNCASNITINNVFARNSDSIITLTSDCGRRFTTKNNARTMDDNHLISNLYGQNVREALKVDDPSNQNFFKQTHITNVMVNGQYYQNYYGFNTIPLSGQNLKLFYNFENNTNDYTNNLFNIVTYANASLTSVGRIGGGFAFIGNGSSPSRATLPNNTVNYSQDFTISVDIFPTGYGNYSQNVFEALNAGENSTGFRIAFDDTGDGSLDRGRIEIFIGNGTYGSERLYGVGAHPQEWTTITVTHTAAENKTKLYVDCRLFSNKTTSTRMNDQPTAYLGAYSGNAGTETFDGTMDNLLIWQRVLPEAEIKSICSSDSEFQFPNIAAVQGTNVNGNLTMQTGNKICLDGSTCSHFMFYNGTATVIQ